MVNVRYAPNLKGDYCSCATAHYNEFLIWCEANVILRYFEGPHSLPQCIAIIALCIPHDEVNPTRWIERGRGAGCLTYWRFRKLSSFVSRNFFTLISSLSEFISVFKQPTPSVVFLSHHHPWAPPVSCETRTQSNWGYAIVIHVRLLSNDCVLRR